MVLDHPNDTVIDKVAKILAPDDYPNWHIYRDWARSLLGPVEHLKTGELSAVMSEPDREITHEELHEYWRV